MAKDIVGHAQRSGESYRRGFIDVVNRDWIGTVTYTGGANPPSYVLT